jgi:hypothetical protein
MRLAVASVCLAAVAACYPADDRRKISSGGPGGGAGFGGGVDATPAFDVAPTVLRGRVCTATDLRSPEACTAHPGAGLPVSDLVSGAMTRTASDGSFTLPLPGAASALVDVENGGDITLTPTVANIEDLADVAVIPIVDTTTLVDLSTSLGAPVGTGQGVLVLFVRNGSGSGQPGFVATPPPGLVNGVFYDDTTSLGWAANGVTGPVGGVLMLGVAPGTYVIQLSNATTGVQTSATVRIVDNHVTFARALVTR